MITGRQIREACALLCWTRDDLIRRTSLSLAAITRAEEREGECFLTYGQEIALRRLMQRADIEFFVSDDGVHSARLREPDPS